MTTSATAKALASAKHANIACKGGSQSSVYVQEV